MRTNLMDLVLATVLGMAGLAALPCGRAAAEDFRVDNAVFADNERQPRLESTTIFCEGLAYDYLRSAQGEEETVFDKGASRFVLLDVKRRIRTEIPFDKVTSLCEHLKTWAANQADPLLSFLAHPKFAEQFHPETGKLVLTSPLVTYELTTVACDAPALRQQYREFCDWSCQLNTLLNPGTQPPFARLTVNATLDARQRFPQEIKRTMQIGPGFPPKRMVVRSKHRLIEQLAESDRRRVEQTQQYQSMFRPVDYDDYQKKPSE